MINSQKQQRVYGLLNSFFGIAGGEIRFVEVFKRMRNFDKIVITPALGEDFCREKALNASYIQTTKETQFKNVILTYIRRILKVFSLKISINNKDIIYSSSDFLPDVAPAYFYKKTKGVQWIQVIHHLYQNPVSRVGGFLANWVGYISQRMSFALIKRDADLVIVVNPLVKHQLCQMGFSSDEIFVNYNGVDLDRIRTSPALTSGFDGVFLGRLNASKGIFDLLEIWQKILIEKPQAKLALIGGGTEQIEQRLKKEIIANGLAKNIVLLGYLKDADAFAVLKASKVFVFPSHEEGFGLAVLEAMACGLPVVAWDLPVYRNFFPEGMMRTKMGNIHKFSEHILKLLNDDQLRAAFSIQALKVSNQYSWDTIADRESKLVLK